ncbi:VOC family protein [Paenibacillus sp. J2TS4]|uniref:VOC family protein n=1 Tax=Paenibacillus sp. J2TS4 TaxID=2807194 RepID=UPI001B2E1BFC|nr:VOC family protein [Paenibacillus sp. J2TS4]GIP31283.1 hypothetical protein J2TS4_04930 [Paenibacillus sp. J2TS4]
MSAEVMEFTFHHIGLACKSLAAEIKTHESLGYVVEGAPFHDPIQQINGIFIVHGPMRIELIEPAGDHSPVLNILARGIKMYHQCFECLDIHKSISDLEAQGAHTIVEPTPAVAFGGRPISFLMLRTRLIVELIQR